MYCLCGFAPLRETLFSRSRRRPLISSEPPSIAARRSSSFRRRWNRPASRPHSNNMNPLTAFFRSFLLASLGALACGSMSATDVQDIGSRRELLVDDFLIADLGGAKLTLHKPEPRDVVITCDQPWEGN